MRKASSAIEGIGAAVVRFWRSAAGNVSIIACISIPALMGAVGVAADFAQFTRKQSELQGAADSAAIAGARELSIATSTDGSIASAAETFSKAVTHSHITSTVNIDRSNAAVEVVIEEKWTPFFAHFLGAQITPIIVRATASLTGQSNLCVLALSSSAPKSVELKMNAVLRAPSCGVFANSVASNSISVTKDATIDSDLVCTAGGVSTTGGTITKAATTDCPRTEDPLASRPAPSVGSCDYNNTSISSGNVSLSPGTYCGGITVASTAVVTFNPGTYVIKDGPFVLAGSATIKGNHVGFYLAGDTATLNFTANSSVDLNGPATGGMAGILFFEDRAAPLGRVHLINSSNAHNMTGTIYLSRGILRVNPLAAVAQNSAYTAIIADKLQVFDGPELTLNTNYSATDVPVPTGIRSSNDVVLTE